MYIVGSKHKVTGALSISPHPRIHKNLHGAEAEAQRLARIEPVKAFVVLQIRAAYQAADVVSVDPGKLMY